MTSTERIKYATTSLASATRESAMQAAEAAGAVAAAACEAALGLASFGLGLNQHGIQAASKALLLTISAVGVALHQALRFVSLAVATVLAATLIPPVTAIYLIISLQSFNLKSLTAVPWTEIGILAILTGAVATAVAEYAGGWPPWLEHLLEPQPRRLREQPHQLLEQPHRPRQHHRRQISIELESSVSSESSGLLDTPRSPEPMPPPEPRVCPICM